MKLEYFPDREGVPSLVGFRFVSEKASIRINPGLNDVPDQVWKAIKSEAMIVDRLDRKAIVVVDDAVEVPSTPRKSGKGPEVEA